MNATVELQGTRLTLRRAKVDEIGLVFATWMSAARQLRGNVRLSVFNRFYPDIVHRLLETEPVVTLTREGEDTPHAWACGRPENLLHFAYVPFKLRGNGLGREVVRAVLGDYPSTVWVTASPLTIPHHARYVYNPYLRPS